MSFLVNEENKNKNLSALSHEKFYFPGMKFWVHMFFVKSFVKSLFYENLAAYFLSEYIIPQITSVARGGGGAGAGGGQLPPPPPPIMLFRSFVGRVHLEICRYM